MPTLTIPGYTLRPLGGDRLTRGFRRSADTETYVVEVPDSNATRGQVQLVNFNDGKGWIVWHAPGWMPRALQNAAQSARNEPRSYTLRKLAPEAKP